MSIRFPFERERSSLFGWVYRPYAVVSFWSKKWDEWLDIGMIVDSGADYTMLPRTYIAELGIDGKHETRELSTRGVGGSSRVYLLRRKHRIKLGRWERQIPLGFIDAIDIPPLLGRQDFMETFRFTLHNHTTEIDIG
ncbi:hypothetical protein A2875_02745 [Candidatus Gottesmanbacteria bacterium RIFCSPHIGHO2_01_FULL_46_14]|uniref:Peptidase A2 domain-containing protein n=3 Tax=Microgenomates group TaxID=1794810 RepID=A0A1F5ZPW2_9BACT|nr:MAG: hypothetical protein UU34_C0005G0032 [Candidatus Curtissbacteria bacterium GW2011_GWA1_41_11]OGG14423.1 MAG: hypothetical protein A2875_02745 [Candidatus Gottesmanbacteria bacterium RIFCSPHIGHO2_01_FULL_46_14]OGG28558.1 MAG: hypothetical protein A2971_03685 [Candidatus Gottesmanbacteria bacterium RIFCSPLOWO2_01_FULL_46_21]